MNRKKSEQSRKWGRIACLLCVLIGMALLLEAGILEHTNIRNVNLIAVFGFLLSCFNRRSIWRIIISTVLTRSKTFSGVVRDISPEGLSLTADAEPISRISKYFGRFSESSL